MKYLAARISIGIIIVLTCNCIAYSIDWRHLQFVYENARNIEIVGSPKLPGKQITYHVEILYPAKSVVEYINTKLIEHGYILINQKNMPNWIEYPDSTTDYLQVIRAYGSEWYNKTYNEKILVGLRYAKKAEASQWSPDLEVYITILN